MTPSEQQAEIVRDLVSCLHGLDGAVQLADLAHGAWPDVSVLVEGVTVGHIYKTEAAVPFLRVRHLAVETGLERKGYGLAIVEGLVAVARKLRMETIFFEVESRPPGYEQFFLKRVGATQMAATTKVAAGFMLRVEPDSRAAFSSVVVRQSRMGKTSSKEQLDDVLAAVDNIIFSALSLTGSRSAGLKKLLVVFERQRLLLSVVASVEAKEELRRVNLAISLLKNLGAI